MPTFGDLGSKFSKTSDRFDITNFEIRYMRNFVKIRKLIRVCPKCPDFPNFEIMGCFGSFPKFFGLFWLVPVFFALFGSFWLVWVRFGFVPSFSKYAISKSKKVC